MSLGGLVNLLLGLLGVAALAIGAMVFLIGPHPTATFFGNLADTIGIGGAYAGGLQHPNIDSEMRFFTVFWFAFGLWILVNLRRSSPSRGWVYVAAALFFAGGIGRVLSIWQTNASPDPLFIGLMWIELTGPVAAALLHFLAAPVPAKETS